jgi:anti-anti-sigma regulatory factor
VWHDRKAWWQQEQAILAYYILAGSLGSSEHLRLAREAAAYYNAYFLDHDEGGVYFNVLANGTPYLSGGNERLKGSHSMSGYHSIELCYLAQTYINLLVSKEPLDLHFKPKANAFADNVLRVAPDLLPPGSVRLTDVWVDDQPYADFDADALTVKLPPGQEVRVKVRITPTSDKFDTRYDVTDGAVRITLRGDLDPDVVAVLRRDLERAMATNLPRVVLHVRELRRISEEGIRELLFLRQKMELMEQFVLVGAAADVRQAFDDAGDAFRAGGEFICVDDESELAQ